MTRTRKDILLSLQQWAQAELERGADPADIRDVTFAEGMRAIAIAIVRDRPHAATGDEWDEAPYGARR